MNFFRFLFVALVGMVGGLCAILAAYDFRCMGFFAVFIGAGIFAVLGDRPADRRYHDAPVCFNRRK